MKTSSLFHPLTSPISPFSGTLSRRQQPYSKNHNQLATNAFKKYGRNGKIVDENMIVLRERIRKMREENEYANGDNGLPDNWMEWEKSYFCSGSYHSDVYEVIAFLQRFLMETRPSVALGMMAVLAFGGSTFTETISQLLVNSIHLS